MIVQKSEKFIFHKNCLTILFFSSDLILAQDTCTLNMCPSAPLSTRLSDGFLLIFKKEFKEKVKQRFLAFAEDKLKNLF